MAHHMDFGHMGFTQPGGRGLHRPHAKYHGFCHSCCHPVSKCCCHRECRKESKELLVNALDRPLISQELVEIERDSRMNTILNVLTDKANMADEEKKKEEDASAKDGTPLLTNVGRLKHDGILVNPMKNSGKAVIGGGCCVHLSIEYMPIPELRRKGIASAGDIATVSVNVIDSESTVLGWEKLVQPGYHIKEGIITTHPGALLSLKVINAIARVRWCEVFSC